VHFIYLFIFLSSSPFFLLKKQNQTKMTSGGCIWGLLSMKELEFIHVSSFKKLKGHSLFQFIHPDEVLLAERDLFKFIKSNKFGGSITR
jgi:hypothetical protein